MLRLVKKLQQKLPAIFSDEAFKRDIDYMADVISSYGISMKDLIQSFEKPETLPHDDGQTFQALYPD